jgi:hypothetical protein
MRPVVVVETPEFQSVAERLMSEAEVGLLIDHLARAPTAGVIIPGTGGVRKLRWGFGGKGKRGGARIIYYFQDARYPLLLLTAYSKSEQTDLTPAQRERLGQFVRTLKRGRSH